MTSTAPSQRADARRNRHALVEAAREVFGEHGLDAPLDAIAQRAGIGNATLYRHFPDRRRLVAAVFAEELAQYAELARLAVQADDPGAAFRDYLTRICALQAGSRGLADLLTSTMPSDPDLDALRKRARLDLGRLIRRAQRAGALRTDFRPHDVVLILRANAGVIHHAADHPPKSSARLAVLLLDGLHAAATPGAPAPRRAEAHR